MREREIQYICFTNTVDTLEQRYTKHTPSPPPPLPPYATTCKVEALPAEHVMVRQAREPAERGVALELLRAGSGAALGETDDVKSGELAPV